MDCREKNGGRRPLPSRAAQSSRRSAFPGLQGGNNWGGGALDPTTGLLYLNTSDLGQVTELVPSTGPLAYERGPTSGRFMQTATRLPCQAPPWGQLHAIDTATGAIRWQATLGVSDNLPAGLQDTGRPNIGGPIVTGGGLVFVGATDDNRFRAFDARSGQLLWSHTLEASAHATPITYRGADARQYVAVTATGGSFLDSPVTADTLVAFAQPMRRPPDPYAGRKRLLVIADLSTGNQIAHLATSHAIATIERLGRESGAYVAILRTDTALVTKGEVWGTGEYAAGGSRQASMHNLDYFDAVLFYTNGETRMTEEQKRDLLEFIGQDGKGFIGVHTAAITAASWPEYAEMLGGFFDNHPWNVASARIVVERPDSPIMRGSRPAWSSSTSTISYCRNRTTAAKSTCSRDSIRKPRSHGSRRASHGRGLSDRVDQAVRQWPRVLFLSRPHGRRLGRSARADDVPRRDQVGDRRRRDASPTPAHGALKLRARYSTMTA